MPCLIFGTEAALLKTNGANWISENDAERKRLERMFLNALSGGDRKYFIEYCADTQTQTCEIFILNGLPSYRYAFCEKHVSGNGGFTVVFLAEGIGQFRCLLSPATLSPPVTVRRIFYELFSLTEESHATPEISLSGNAAFPKCLFPTLFHSMPIFGNQRVPCDIFRITEIVVQSLGEAPVFRNTVLEFRKTGIDPHLRVLEVSSNLYVHILTSVLTAMMTISVNHTIILEIRPFTPAFGNTAGTELLVSTAVRDTKKYKTDGSSLKILAPDNTVNDILLTAASVLACIANIGTAVQVNTRTHVLTVCLTINPEHGRVNSDFKYRDPYRTARDVVSELLLAIPVIRRLSGNKNKRKKN